MKLIAHCSECDYKFDPDSVGVHIGTKFLIFQYGYIICPRCWHKIKIPEQYERYFGLSRE